MVLGVALFTILAAIDRTMCSMAGGQRTPEMGKGVAKWPPMSAIPKPETLKTDLQPPVSTFESKNLARRRHLRKSSCSSARRSPIDGSPSQHDIVYVVFQIPENEGSPAGSPCLHLGPLHQESRPPHHQHTPAQKMLLDSGMSCQDFRCIPA